MPLQLTWGLQPPPTATVAWGARAIYKLRTIFAPRRNQEDRTVVDIDILWDRQCAKGGSLEERKALVEWFNDKGYPALQERCLKGYVTPECADVIKFDADGYYVEASPRESCGYLYICVSKA